MSTEPELPECKIRGTAKFLNWRFLLMLGNAIVTGCGFAILIAATYTGLADGAPHAIGLWFTIIVNIWVGALAMVISACSDGVISNQYNFCKFAVGLLFYGVFLGNLFSSLFGPEQGTLKSLANLTRAIISTIALVPLPIMASRARTP